MEKIIGIYRIINTITGDFYIGSSKDIKRRWRSHKCASVWKKYPNKQLYLDMQKYGVDKFEFEILAEVEADSLKEKEQEFIEMLNPTYNQMNAKGLDYEKRKEYEKSDKHKESHRKASNKYNKSDKGKETRRKYYKSEKFKESHKKANKKYDNQLCCYNGETLTLNALRKRFRRQGIDHPTTEAKKYLIL